MWATRRALRSGHSWSGSGRDGDRGRVLPVTPAGSGGSRRAPGDPDGYVGGLEGLIDGGGQLLLSGREVDRPAEPAGEGGHGGLGVVVGAVEAPVDDPLDPPAQRVEQRGRGQRGGRDRHW